MNPLEENSTIILCEVYNVDTSPHVSNTRKKLIDTLEDGDEEWVGFEQEYTLFNNKTRKPLGWPEIGTPPPQGDYYCGRNAGESISKEHLDACIEAGISICGTNAEVMLGQWEYQIGAGRAVDMSDDLWVARWLLERICESYDVRVSLQPKPIEGDWNGAGCHTNFSTKEMREDGGYDKIIEACEKLSKNPQEHIDVYGVDNNKRLTGLHETCSITEFRYGISDRGASIRIPWQVGVEKRGYLEDRRPSANCDPYLVSQKLIETVCR
jgi:glutamine synthetase